MKMNKPDIIPNSMPHSGAWTRRSVTDMVILHHAAARSYSPEQVNTQHNNQGWNGIGYNFYIRKNGLIYEGRPIWAVGAHALNFNSRSVGICCEGDFNVEYMQDPQLAALSQLLTYVLSYYDLSAGNVRLHRDVNSTDCPGKNYPAVHEILAYNKESEVTEMDFNAWYDKINPYYKTIDDVPEWWRDETRKLLDSGAINGGTDDNPNDVNMRMETLQAIIVANRIK